MTKQEANNWYRRMIRCLKRNKFCVKLNSDPSIYGEIDWEPNEIKLNPRKRSPLLRTIIHEILHSVDYDIPETELLRLESELFNLLSDRQLERLFKQLMVLDLG